VLVVKSALLILSFGYFLYVSEKDKEEGKHNHDEVEGVPSEVRLHVLDEVGSVLVHVRVGPFVHNLAFDGFVQNEEEG